MWAPRNLNIATPCNGLQAFSGFLQHIGYQLNNTSIYRNEATGTLTHSEYIKSDDKIVTVTEGKEKDSFLGVILRSNHTAVMNFITLSYCCVLYPTQTLEQQITYVYRCPPSLMGSTKLESRNFTVITNSIDHPANLSMCCPNVQHQFAEYSGIGLFEWNTEMNTDNLLSRSYTWWLGDVCLHEGCRAKKISHALVRRNS